MVVRVLGSLSWLVKSQILIAGSGSIAFVSWKRTLAARMAEKHAQNYENNPLVLIAVDASVQAENAVDCELLLTCIEMYRKF